MKIFTRIFIAVSILAVSVLCMAEEPAKTPQQMILDKLGVKKAMIVNADDFGGSPAMNAGILKGMKEGIITSTTLMVPAPFAKEAYEIIKNNPGLDVGVHLNLAQDTAGGYGPLSPREKVPSLLAKDGTFPTTIAPIINAKKDEIIMELTAQLDTALANGVDATHFDCHKGFYHVYDPKMLKITMDLAVKYDLPIRWVGKSSDAILVKNGVVTPDYLVALEIPGPLAPKKEKLLSIINNMPDGITELMLHPAEGDPETYDRATHLALALDPDVKAAIEKNGIRLIGYKELREIQRQLRKEKQSK